MVEIGDKAPDFTLPSHLDQKVTLSQHFGKDNVVLAFYVLDWTPVCTTEMCDFTTSMQDLQKVNAKVYGVSVDHVFSHKAWAEKHNIKIPLLSDFNKEVSKKYGVLYDEILGLRGVSKRSIFIIDKKGVVRYKWVTEDPKVPPKMEEIKKSLGQLS